jgi:hypothetical protein
MGMTLKNGVPPIFATLWRNSKKSYPTHFRLSLRPYFLSKERFLLRRIKQVKRKAIDFSVEDWKRIQQRANVTALNTTDYIRSMALNGQINVVDMKLFCDILMELSRIGNNINQIARRVNETNSIYANDVNQLKEDFEEICHMLSQKLYEVQCEKA